MIQFSKISFKITLRKLGLHHLFINYILYSNFIRNCLTNVNCLRWPKIDLVMIVWPPAIQYFDNIKIDILNNHEILFSQIIQMDTIKFKEFVHKIYAIDHASIGKITGKIDHLQTKLPAVGIILVRILKPKMIAQDAFNYVRCKDVNMLKQSIRDKYKNKLNDYIYDIIIHSTEVDYQNNKVYELIEEFKAVNVD